MEATKNTTLAFLADYTTAQMAEVLKTTKINLVKSPKSGKNFFANSIGQPVGAVSSKITTVEDLQKDLKFCKVQVVEAGANGKAIVDDNGKMIAMSEPFLMLCLQGEASDNTWGTLEL